VLDKLVEYIDSLSIFKDLDFNLGKILIFLMVLCITFIVMAIVKKLLTVFLNRYLTPVVNKIDSITINDILPLIKPIFILGLLYGFEIAFNILWSNKLIDILFFTFKTFMVIYFIFITIDILLELYSISISKKDALKKQLMALSIKVFRVTVVIIAILLILKEIGFNITAFVASLGIGGIAIAMASKDTIANFFGSLKIIFDNSFTQGDWIVVDGAEGTVIELGFISTKIRTFDNALITLSNSTLVNKSVKNYSKRKIGRRIKFTLPLTYESKSEDIKQCIYDIRNMLKNHPDIVECEDIESKRGRLVEANDKEGIKTTLLVYLDSLGESSIDILVYAFSKTILWDDWLEVKEDILFKTMKIVEDNNLELALPTQSLYINGNKDG
jgi:MscS family membrane protein